MSRPVLATQELGAVEEPLERSPCSEGCVVDGEEVDVKAGHEEVAGGVVGEVELGREEDQVDGETRATSCRLHSTGLAGSQAGLA